MRSLIIAAAALALTACGNDPEPVDAVAIADDTTGAQVTGWVQECINGQQEAHNAIVGLQEGDMVAVVRASVPVASASDRCRKAASALRTMKPEELTPELAAIQQPAATAFQEIGDGLGKAAQGMATGNVELTNEGVQLYSSGVTKLESVNASLRG